MAFINRLTQADTVTFGDLFTIFQQSNGDARTISGTVLLAFMQDNLTFTEQGTGLQKYITQRNAPSSDAFDIAITDLGDGANIHLILTPTAGFATGAITLPAFATLLDGQTVLVNCTQQVTAFTVNANGAGAVTGEPSALGADDFFTLKYDAVTTTWYRVG